MIETITTTAQTPTDARRTIGLAIALLGDALAITTPDEVNAVAWPMAKGAAYIAAGFAWLAVKSWLREVGRVFRFRKGS
jgi:hypothetical protein